MPRGGRTCKVRSALRQLQVAHDGRGGGERQETFLGAGRVEILPGQVRQLRHLVQAQADAQPLPIPPGLIQRTHELLADRTAKTGCIKTAAELADAQRCCGRGACGPQLARGAVRQPGECLEFGRREWQFKLVRGLTDR